MLVDVDLGADIQMGSAGPAADQVVASLPLDDELIDDLDWCWDPVGITVGGVAYGPFADHGWLPLDVEHGGVPAHRLLVEVTHSEEGGFTSGHMTWLLGEVRPGLLVDHYDIDGVERSIELVPCEEREYAARMRDALSADVDLVELAIERALDEGPGSWSGDELDPVDGSPTASIWVWYDEAVLAQADRSQGAPGDD